LAFATETGIAEWAPLLEQQEAAAPSPIRLATDWPRYFEAGPEILKARVEIMAQQLPAMLQSLPEPDRGQAEALIGRILKSLQTLLELRARKPSRGGSRAMRPCLHPRAMAGYRP
jgi:hypothetical protein